MNVRVQLGRAAVALAVIAAAAAAVADNDSL